MHPHRKNRLILIVFLVVGTAATLGLTLIALQDNLDFFYDPAAILSGTAPVEQRIRAGGMVLPNSLTRSADGLGVRFRIGDLKGAEVTVLFEGILPDLFREGQGVVVVGALDTSRTLHAIEVLAKHDENYMPPQVADILSEPEVE